MTDILGLLRDSGSILQVFSMLSAGNAARQAGANQQIAANYEAQQLDVNAGQSVAASQRAAFDERRRADMLASRAIAVAAASGAGVGGNVTKIIADIAGEGAYRSSVALYEGEERARQLRIGADARRLSGAVAAQGGEQRQAAYNMGATGAAVRGLSLYEKYGRGGSKAVTDIGGGVGSGDTTFDVMDNEIEPYLR